MVQFPLVLLFVLAVTAGAAANPHDESGPSPRWCLPKPGVSPENLQNVVNYVCSHMACPQPTTDRCFAYSDLSGRAGIIMNLYYQRFGRTEQACYFEGNGMIVTTDPSSGSCLYPSSSSSSSDRKYGYFWFRITLLLLVL